MFSTKWMDKTYQAHNLDHILWRSIPSLLSPALVSPPRGLPTAAAAGRGWAGRPGQGGGRDLRDLGLCAHRLVDAALARELAADLLHRLPHHLVLELGERRRDGWIGDGICSLTINILTVFMLIHLIFEMHITTKLQHCQWSKDNISTVTYKQGSH